MIEKMIENLGPCFDKVSTPQVYGFSVIGHSEGETLIREFGSLPAESAADVFAEKNSLVPKRKPLIDVIESDDKIHVNTEIPGISTGEIILKATDSTLDLEASHGRCKYSQHIFFSSKVDPESTKATYRNGILAVVLKMFNSDKTVLVHIE